MSYEEIHKLYDQIQQMDPDHKGVFEVMLIMNILLKCVYAIVLGLVVWALGRRLIQASLTALREGRQSDERA